MLKTLGSIESTIRPGKGGVRVGGNGGDKINDNATSLMLRTCSSKDSLTSVTQIVVEYDGVDDGDGCSGDFDKKFHPKLQYDIRATYSLTSILRASSSTDSSTSMAQIVVKFDGVNTGGGAISKLVKKSSKSRRIVKKPKKPQKSKKIAKTIGPKERLLKH